MTVLRIALIVLIVATGLARTAEDGVALFETKIRPVLADKCYGCHSDAAKKLKGDLHLDSRDGVLRGGESGPALVPGKPDESRMIAAIAWRDPDLRMPPKERLPAEVVDDFAHWIALGAPDPRDGAATARAARPVAARDHWSFQPPKRVAAPTPRAATRVRTPIDAFVAARLEAEGLGFAPDADRRALIRRATIDLTGLPPTIDEVDAFVADASDDAYARVVDRLLASPRYGERWGRHWLDVARYADTRGDIGDGEKRYPFAYTYRDWVIGALNADLPYDRFVIDQIAADVAAPDEPAALAALGFLTVGRRFLNRVPDIIDDRIDVVCRGTLGLTVACARCHDHKYDPIPTADYYALYSVFDNASEPDELPLLPGARDPATAAAYDSAIGEARAAVDAFVAKRHGEVLAALRSGDAIARYLVAAHDAGDDDKRVDEIADQRNLRAPVIRRWRDAVKRAGDDDAVFGAWRAAAALADGEIAAKARDIAQRAHGPVAAALAARPPASLADVAARYGEAFAAHAGDAAEGDADGEALRRALRCDGAPTAIALTEAEKTAFDGDDVKKLRELRAKADAIVATHPGSPPRAMVVRDAPEPHAQHVFKRGDPGSPGDEVPRRFLAALSGPERAPFAHGSGRVDLARAIADAANPLTARVIVNRVWAWHFGAGIVRTPSDFGARGDAPTHPELLDWLALRFVDDGWSLKGLHRLIMLSTTYRQAAEHAGVDAARDPEDRLLWRFPRSRADFETLRDAMLAAAGTLDERRGGRPVDLFARPYPTRRTVYGFIDRENLPTLLRTFDLASPDAHAPQRYQTTVPQQALWLINDPFVIAQARAIASRVGDGDDAARTAALYRIVLARAPTDDEVAAGRAFLAASARLPAGPPPPPPSVWAYGYGALDAAATRVAAFTRLPAFGDGAWRGGDHLPDPALGWVSWRADGGHPGRDAAHAAIRRWTAPRDAVVAIAGKLAHGQTEGDGVRARIVASRSGPLGEWRAHHGDAATAVARVALRAGDTIDFVVDCLTSDGWDSFAWAPVVSALDGDGETWDAAKQFAGPPAPAEPLTPWQKYAQVLLMSDEFAFTE